MYRMDEGSIPSPELMGVQPDHARCRGWKAKPVSSPAHIAESNEPSLREEDYGSANC